MSRLEFAPKSKEIEITDIKSGIGVFAPKPDKPISFTALKEALGKAGYTLDRAEITLSGTFIREGNAWLIIVEPSKQRFALEGPTVTDLLSHAASNSKVEVTGDWKTEVSRIAAREVITPRTISQEKTTGRAPSEKKALYSSAVGFEHASFRYAGFTSMPATRSAPIDVFGAEAVEPLAPIRTTSPGLTVYKGGAVTPRFYFVKQALGGIDVTRQLLDISLSYTPSPRVQVEMEVPFARTSFDDGVASGSRGGLGNITVWGKYRFFRTVKTYGDRQAAVRFGLELPTGRKTAPAEREVNATEFVRQQLTPISGGLSPHLDLSFSQAGGRFIFGGNVQGIVRSERDGFRMGHEIRVNTDLEYVLLPREYRAPGKELFVILETTFVQRGRGRVNRSVVEGSKSTEVYLSPGLQFAADQRFVIEGSVQLPVILNTGPFVLRTNLNLLLGVKYLF